MPPAVPAAAIIPAHTERAGGAMILRRLFVSAAVIGCSGLALTAIAAKDADNAATEWHVHSGDNAARKYSPLDQINKATVSALQIAWRRPQIDPAVAAIVPPALRLSNNFRSTPLMVRGVMYASNGVGLAEAFDPETGRTVWVQKPGN